MKRFLALTLCLGLLLSAACAEPLSVESEDVIMPAILRQISVPAGIAEDYGEKMSAVEYDLGMRYSGQNADVSITIWCTNGQGGRTLDEIAQDYVESPLGYEVQKSTLNGDKAYLISRPLENLEMYLLTNEADNDEGADVAYTISITAFTETGEKLRDEVFASFRSWN